MDHNSFKFVKSVWPTSKALLCFQAQLCRKGDAVSKLVMPECLRIDTKALQMHDQQWRRLLDLKLSRRDLLCAAVIAVELVPLVKQLLVRERFNAVR